MGGEKRLLENVRTLLITLGGNGFKIVTKDREKNYPCLKVEVVDTTAAGDTLCGGLAARLAYGESVENAALFGSKAASIACTKKGAQPSVPKVSTVMNFKL